MTDLRFNFGWPVIALVPNATYTQQIRYPGSFFFSEGEEEILLIVIAQWLTAIPTELGAGGCRFET